MNAFDTIGWQFFILVAVILVFVPLGMVKLIEWAEDWLAAHAWRIWPRRSH